MGARPLLASLLLCLTAGCYTEIGNPAKESRVTATFSIDYTPEGLPKRSQADPPPPSVDILQFYFNVVEANYRTVEDEEGRIWKVPDSLGRSVDFTGKDSAAILPPVDVPPDEWTILKLESRIPDHDTLDPDTLDFDAYADRGYIKGIYSRADREIRFLCQLPNVRKVNLVYNEEILERYRRGDAYDLEFVFYPHRWLAGVDLLEAETFLDRTGRAVALVDLEHNRPLFDSLFANFFKSFNSYKVWKEGSPNPPSD
jgi:hypothetical protein